MTTLPNMIDLRRHAERMEKRRAQREREERRRALLKPFALAFRDFFCLIRRPSVWLLAFVLWVGMEYAK